ncbi:uncharacterized protein LOC144706518 isoform X4 [Wolffia australiana]
MIFPGSGKFRGIAIVSFKMKAAAKRALALDGSYRSWWEGRGCICLQMLTPRRQHRGEGPEAWVRGVELKGQPGKGGGELHLAGYHHEPPRAVWQWVRAGAGLPHFTHRRQRSKKSTSSSWLSSGQKFHPVKEDRSEEFFRDDKPTDGGRHLCLLLPS